MSFTYDYPRPAVTVDCVVFGFDEGDLKVLLIRRDVEPFRGKWALPGGWKRFRWMPFRLMNSSTSPKMVKYSWPRIWLRTRR